MRRRQPQASSVLLTACVVALLGYLLLQLVGLRSFTVTSPSMGTNAPVGSLVTTAVGKQPALGDVVVFNRNGHRYSHRVTEVLADGYRTKGDANGTADPWVVGRADVVGRAVSIVPGGGYLLKGLPVFTAIFALAVFLTRRQERPWRRALRMIGGSLAFSLASLWVSPWVGSTVTSQRQSGDGIEVTMASTGLLPVRVTAVGGTSVDLGYGSWGTAFTTHKDDAGLLHFVPSLHLNLLQTLALVAFCLGPLLLGLLWSLGRQPAPVATAATVCHGATPAPRPRVARGGIAWLRWGIAAAGVASVLALLLAVVPAQGAFAASLRNTSDSLKMARYFSCDAYSSDPSPVTGPTFAWRLSGEGAPKIADLSGNGFTATYHGTTRFPATTGCPDVPHPSTYFDGYDTCVYGDIQYRPPLTSISVSLWFNAAGTVSGPMYQVAGSLNIAPPQLFYDESLYLDNGGHLVWYAEPNAVHLALGTPGTYRDGAWHQAVVTVSSAGTKIYVDGKLAASDPTLTSVRDMTGGAYDRVGCGTASSLKNADGTAFSGGNYFLGHIQYAARWDGYVLTDADVADMWIAR